MSNSLPNHDAPQTPPQAGRDATGRFATGNKGGPGNPFGRRAAALRKLLLEIVSDDELRAVVTKLLELAKAGDVAAAKLVLQYAVGRPAEAPDPDRVDVEEWKLAQQTAVPEAAWAAVLQMPTAELVNGYNRITMPYTQMLIRESLLDGLREDAKAAPSPSPDGRNGGGKRRRAEPEASPVGKGDDWVFPEDAAATVLPRIFQMARGEGP